MGRKKDETLTVDESMSTADATIIHAGGQPMNDVQVEPGEPAPGADPAVTIEAVEKVFGKRVAWLDSTGTISLSRSKMSPTDVVAIVAAVARLIAKLPGGGATLQSMSAAVQYECGRANNLS